jgi:hypothetical protein
VPLLETFQMGQNLFLPVPHDDEELPDAHLHTRENGALQKCESQQGDQRLG